MADKSSDKKKKSDGNHMQLDKRVVDRLMQRGVVGRQEFEAHLKGLPDLTEQADSIADKVYQEQ